jgi:hypothetical protein
LVVSGTVSSVHTRAELWGPKLLVRMKFQSTGPRNNALGRVGDCEFSAHKSRIMGTQAAGSDEVSVDRTESCQAKVQLLNSVTLTLSPDERSSLDSTFT